MNRLLAFWLTHRVELATLLGQHVLLVAGSTLVAVALGVPLGVFAARRPRLAAPLMAVASIVQTVPSLAMFGFLLPVPFIGGVGARAALVVLILYGLLPIVRTTIAGLRGIDASIREAGVAMGMTPRELLRQVELPVAHRTRRRSDRGRGRGACARRERRGGAAGRRRRHRRLEELHRAADSRRAPRADDRARCEADGRSPPESRRHADLRSRAVD